MERQNSRSKQTINIRDLADTIDDSPNSRNRSVPPRGPSAFVYKTFTQIPPNHRIIAFLSLVGLAGAYIFRGLWISG